MRFVSENYTEDGRVHLRGYLQEPDILFRGRRERAAVLICPGGAYQYCAAREMDPIAMAFAAKGYHTLILTYSVGEYARGFRPLEEISWAIRTIRDHAAEWGIIPDQIVAAGFSAGGHLALAGGLKAEERANAMILGYPVVDTQLLYGPDVAEDPLVREHCLRLVGRYSAFDVPCEYHLFQEGPHGLALADEVTADGKPQMEQPQAAKWFELAADWLRRTLGGK